MSARKGTLVIFCLLFMLGAVLSCGRAEGPPGTLEGTVGIGPIWPVERPGENPPVPPEVFEVRKVLVYDRDGSRLIATVDIVQIDQSQEGRYSVQLGPGTYTIDINRAGIDRSAEVPARIEIKAGETLTLNIDIDTGIR